MNPQNPLPRAPFAGFVVLGSCLFTPDLKGHRPLYSSAHADHVDSAECRESTWTRDGRPDQVPSPDDPPWPAGVGIGPR